MKTALVTGSSGFVGRHLVPKLQAAGYHTTTIDRDGGFTLEAWLHSLRVLGSAAPKYDVIVHLAANIEDISKRIRGGVQALDDIALDLKMCSWVEANPPKEAFVVMSSCAVDYPEDPYAWTKLTLERTVKELDKSGVPTIILRPFSGYGWDQKPSYPFPAIVGRAIRKESPLTVWGSLETVRDWIHIEDLSQAIVHSIHNFPYAVPIEIGSGNPTPFGALARAIADSVGYKPEIVADTTKPTGSRWRVADRSKAEKYGFFPTISLKEGINEAVAKLTSRMHAANA